MRDERRPTLTDVATRAGVSKSLVSLVMRDEPGASAETRRRVLEAADALGYQPDSRARLLRSGRSRLLGVVFGIQHPFHADLVTGLYTAARETGHELALSAVTPQRSEHEAVTGLLQDRCEALILLGPQAPAASLARLASRLPVVVLARAVRAPEVDVVRSADAEGLHLAVDHLAGLGHRHITHIDGGRAPGAADRRRGYRTAMRRHGLTGELRILPGGLTESDGAAAARQLLADPPTAVTVFNDRCATGVLDVFARAGVDVPYDISVIGFDDSSLARLAHVNLTTVAQDVPTMTRLAVTRAIARVAGRDPGLAEASASITRPAAEGLSPVSLPRSDREVIVPPRLVIRGTTGRPS
ncbi:LacI family DNA-binding transcriptional regulator [Actinoplanes sp. URMC 104]|uniref:LacI family DNA-binding transcriptional regulator n=1 Tax=Actinoplanes sp. URMC 104 TaxID=3423409 RepID=UPI003F1A3495